MAARSGTAAAALAALVSIVVVAGGASLPVVAVRLSAPRPGTVDRPGATHHVHHRSRPPAASSVTGATCPLTGLPAPGGNVPARPALAVKVDNYPSARPQAALDQADVVFEEPVEGGITRLVAVYQCQSPPLIGPVRSAREPDVAIADELSRPVLVHAGGIQPILNLLNAANLINVDLVFADSSLDIHPPGRYPPYDTYVAASTMWATAPTDTTPPAPLFSYASTAPTVGRSVASVHIPFSGTNDNRWSWNPSVSRWQLAIGGTTAMTATGPVATGNQVPVTAANVVVLTVHTFTGPWVENSLGAHEVEVVATGSGPAVVLRDGMAISGTWKRPSLNAPPRLVDTQGRPIHLSPGRTWVELVPSTVPVTLTAAPPSGAGTSGAGTSGAG